MAARGARAEGNFNGHGTPMTTPNDSSTATRSAEVQAALRLFFGALRMAAAGYNPSRPINARAGVRIALVGIIQLISELYPDAPTVLLPLNELLYALNDLDLGKVVPLLTPTKVSHSPGTALSDILFRAIAAAAMTCLVDRTTMSRHEAAKDIAKRLSRGGFAHPSGKEITPNQITKWRETMMTELASENRAVARYRAALDWVKDKEPQAAVQFLLDALPDLSPATNPKKPRT
jgi:hypothetical protein